MATPDPTQLSSAALKSQLDVYRHQATTQGLRVLAAGLSGRVQNGSMTEAEKTAEIARYNQMLADLDKQQTLLVQEHEKSGRVSLITQSNLLSAYAKVLSAGIGASGQTRSATTNAEAQRLGQLDEAMTREGPGLQADLGAAYKESASKLKNYMQNGKVTDVAAFGTDIRDNMQKLSADNPKMLMPYMQEVEDQTGIKIDDFLDGKANAPGQGGVPTEFLGKIAGLYNTGRQADLEAQKKGNVIAVERLKSAAEIAKQSGAPGASQFAEQVNTVLGNVDSNGDEYRSSAGSAPPPTPDAPQQEKAAWVQQMSGGKLTLEDDGHVHEKGPDGSDLDKEPYEQFAAYHAPGGGFKFGESMSPYLEQTRQGIVAEMDRIQNSTDRADLETKAHIMQMPEFQKWAQERGYPTGDPASAEQALHKLFNERKTQIRKQKSDTNMISDINNITGVGSPGALKVAASNVRQGIRSILKPGQTAVNPSAAITNGAQTVDQKAPGVTEDAKGVQEARSQIQEPTEFEGKGGYKYRVNGSQVQLIGGPKSAATPDKPIALSGDVAKKALAEMPQTGQPDAMFGPAAGKIDVEKSANPFKGEGPAAEEAVPETAMGKPGQAQLGDSPRLQQLADMEPPDDANDEAPDMSAVPDQEAGSLADAFKKSEAPVDDTPAPAPVEEVSPVDRRTARMDKLKAIQHEAEQRVGTAAPDEPVADSEKPKVDLKSGALAALAALGDRGGQQKPEAPKASDIPGLNVPTPRGPTGEPMDNIPEDPNAPISRKRRWELLHGLGA